MNQNHFFRQPQQRRWLAILLPVLMLAAAALACSVNFSGSGDLTVQQTQTAVSTQLTALAAQITNVASTQAAAQALPTQPPVVITEPPVDLAATQVALSVQLTANAPQPYPIMVETPAAPPTQPPPAQPTSPPPPSGDLQAFMQNASIVVYEDAVVDPSLTQYIKKTLDSMGLQYKWDGNAMGWLKSDLAGGANGRPWDLVIIAVESRDDISGEYFDQVMNVLNQGSSVILEGWHLDEISEGTISPILSKCGVMVYPYFTETGSTIDGVLYPLPGGAAHPLLQDPNSGFSFTRALDTWLWTFDLGSKMALTGQGDAQLLLGTDANSAQQDGTLATCMNGQLTLQTFSSHTFSGQIMIPLWENYITNALRVRMGNSN